MYTIKANQNDKPVEINHELSGIFASKGGMFDVSNPEMEANIGRRLRYDEPTCGVEHEDFTIVCIQKNYKGDMCYRVVEDSDKRMFGRVLNPQRQSFTFID